MLKYLSVFNRKAAALITALLITVSVFAVPKVSAPLDCSVSKINGEGYSTTISSVTKNGSNYTIVLTVSYDGKTSSKGLDHFSVQASSGTFSNILFNVVTGNGVTGTVNPGPNLSDEEISSGFKIDGISNVGYRTEAASFTITYTVTKLQNQKTDALFIRTMEIQSLMKMLPLFQLQIFNPSIIVRLEVPFQL